MTSPTAATIDNLIRNYCNQLGVQPSTAAHVAGLMLAYCSVMPKDQAEEKLTQDVLAAYRSREAWALDYLRCAGVRLYPGIRDVVGAARRSGADPAPVVSGRYLVALTAAEVLVEFVDEGVL